MSSKRHKSCAIEEVVASSIMFLKKVHLPATMENIKTCVVNYSRGNVTVKDLLNFMEYAKRLGALVKRNGEYHPTKSAHSFVRTFKNLKSHQNKMSEIGHKDLTGTATNLESQAIRGFDIKSANLDSLNATPLNFKPANAKLLNMKLPDTTINMRPVNFKLLKPMNLKPFYMKSINVPPVKDRRLSEEKSSMKPGDRKKVHNIKPVKPKTSKRNRSERKSIRGKKTSVGNKKVTKKQLIRESNKVAMRKKGLLRENKKSDRKSQNLSQTDKSNDTAGQSKRNTKPERMKIYFYGVYE